MDRRQLLLNRLDDIGRSLAGTGSSLALLALGSVGRETDRLDDHSDLDFFVLVEPGTKERYLLLAVSSLACSGNARPRPGTGDVAFRLVLLRSKTPPRSRSSRRRSSRGTAQFSLTLVSTVGSGQVNEQPQ